MFGFTFWYLRWDLGSRLWSSVFALIAAIAGIAENQASADCPLKVSEGKPGFSCLELSPESGGAAASGSANGPKKICMPLAARPRCLSAIQEVNRARAKAGVSPSAAGQAPSLSLAQEREAETYELVSALLTSGIPTSDKTLTELRNVVVKQSGKTEAEVFNDSRKVRKAWLGRLSTQQQATQASFDEIYFGDCDKVSLRVEDGKAIGCLPSALIFSDTTLLDSSVVKASQELDKLVGELQATKGGDEELVDSATHRRLSLLSCLLSKKDGVSAWTMRAPGCVPAEIYATIHSGRAMPVDVEGAAGDCLMVDQPQQDVKPTVLDSERTIAFSETLPTGAKMTGFKDLQGKLHGAYSAIGLDGWAELGTMKHGKQEGQRITKESHGIVISNYNYTDGKREGSSFELETHGDGSVDRRIEENWKNGLLEGPRKVTDSKGRTLYNETYKNDKKIGKSEFFRYLDNGSYERTEYHYGDDGVERVDQRVTYDNKGRVIYRGIEDPRAPVSEP